MKSNRYSRQTILSEIGDKGQEMLLQGGVSVIGLGALGSVSSSLLACAGVGNLLLVDRDVVELNNLQRQILYTEKDIGEAKAAIAERRLKELNSEITVKGLAVHLSQQNIERFLRGVDVVVDGTDNMETRFLLNDFCVKNDIPFIYGGAIATYGMTLTVLPKRGPCLRCLFQQTPVPGTLPTCDTFGILNSTPAIIASIQATETMKILMNVGPRRTVLIYDPWHNEQQEIRLDRRRDCICCVKEEYDFLEAKRRDIFIALCGRNVCSLTPPKGVEISFEELEKRLAKIGRTRRGIATLSLAV
ncbi:MAG: ThiF family adenylyltransferase, partial [Thermoplasmata archaeon]